MTAGAPARIEWRRWKTFVIPLVTIAIVVALVRQLAGTAEFFDALENVDWSLLPVVLAVLALAVVGQALRWRLGLAAMGYAIPFRAAFVGVMAAYPLRVVVPSGAGDLMRAAAVRDRVPAYPCFGSVLLDRVMDVQTLCIMTIAGTAVHGLWWWCAAAAGALAALWIGIVLSLRLRARICRLPLLRRAADKIEMVLSAFQAVLDRPRYLVWVTVASLATWMLVLAIIDVLLVMAGAGVGWWTVLSLWPIATFVGILPVTTAGMGTRDAAFVYLLGAVAGLTIASAPVLVATILYSLIGTWTIAIAGIPFLVRVLRHPPPRPADE